MANFFSLQDGDLTSISVYGYSLSAAEVMSNTTGVWLSTVDAYGPSFTGDGSSISAVAVHLSARAADPTSSTLTLKLSSAGSTITETYYVSSFTSYNGSNNLLTTYPQNWQILKLTNTYTLANLSACKLSLATSVTGTLALVCSTSNNNYDKVVLKQSVVVPTSADNIHIGGSLKGLTLDPRTITVTTSTFQNLYIHNGGTLNFPLTSSKTLTLNGAAGLQITSDGILNVGTSSSVIPLSTTHTIVLSNTQIDVHNGGNLNVYGYPKLYTTNLVSDTVAASNTFTTTDVVSGVWNVGDTLTFKPNLTTRNGFDTLVLSGFTGTNTFKTTSNSVYTHTGSATYANIAGVYNLNRNVKIQGLDSTNRGTIRTIDAAKTSINYANLTNLGYNTSSYDTGLELYNNSSGNFTLSSCTFINNSPKLFNTSRICAGFFKNSPKAYCITTNNMPAIGTGDFTIELWVYPTANATINYLIDLATSSTNMATYVRPTIYCQGSTYYYRANGATNLITGPSVVLNAWTHIAVSRINSVTKFFVNGIQYGGNLSDTRNYVSDRPAIGAPADLNGTYDGYISTVRVCTQGLYGSNFTPSFYLPQLSSTILLVFSNPLDRTIVDRSTSNITFTNVGGVTLNTFTKGTNNLFNLYNTTINNNILSSTNFIIKNINIPNSILEVKNNYIFSTPVNGGLIIDTVSGSINMSNNTTVGSQSYGTYLYNNTLTGTYGAINLNSTLQGMYISGANTGTIVGGGINSVKEGVYVDASTSNLSGLSFQNILANNNSSVGFKVSGNSLTYTNPVVLNINGLSSNSNSNAGIEAYNITGNLSSLILNTNLSGSRISIGNGATIFDGLSSTVNGNCLTILSATNYNQTIIKNAFLSSLSATGTALNMSVDKLEEFRLEGSTLSANTPFKITSTRAKLEGSYMFHNSNSNTYGLSSLALTGYQSDVFKESGLVVMRENGLSANHYKYLAAGSITLDKTVVNLPNTVSERLTPWSAITKLRSTSKMIPVNSGDALTISVFIKRSTGYTGAAPRLVAVSNPSIGINGGILSTSVQTSGWELMSATLPATTNLGAIEVYVDCSGNVGSGYINIDSWNFNY